ncbi:MAG TPA: NAD-dependent epimerase/dehydratase family protein [Actinomycetota bacterium]|nr:NAD-dependent epimerase/dehydratase family protein [Actinomycetota bacterium]
MRALVTGATGFIGGRLVPRLVERGHRVTALVRSPDRAAGLREMGVTLAGGDITEPATLEGPMRKADAVFHLAAWYEMGVGDRTKMYQVNVRGTEHVLAAAREAGVGRIVHCSTVGALGAGPIGDIRSETSQHSGAFGSVYEETKWQAHQVARRAAADGAPVVIVMPGAVYGPGDPSVLGAMIRLYAKGWLIALPFQDSGFSWVHVDDVAEGIVLAHEKGRAGEEYVIGGANATVGDVFRQLAPLTGIRAPRFELPGWMLRASMPLSPVIARTLNAGPRIVQDALSSMRGSFMAFSTKAEAELGYRHRSIEEGMPETVEWFKENR